MVHLLPEIYSGREMNKRWGYQKNIDHLEEHGTDGRKILNQILKKYDGKVWTRMM